MTPSAPATPPLSPPAVPPQIGSTLHLLGSLVTFRATTAQTQGTFSLVETRTAPGQGTPPHTHANDTEAFLVLEGEYEFMVGDVTARSGPGSFHFVPTGTPHAFSNPGNTPARMLILHTPGLQHEQFFLEAGDPVADANHFPPQAPPDLPRLLQAAQRNGIEMLPLA